MTLYFNEHEFLKAIDTIESNPLKTINLLKEYIKKYQNDFCAYAYLAETLINSGNFDKSKIGNCLLYLRSKTGRRKYLDTEMFSYLNKQIKEYKEEAFFDHIKKYIPSNRNIFYLYVDKYVFKYDFCGRSSGKVSDYFRVIALHNSNEFLTMYPINFGNELDYIDLNYLRKEKDSIKRLCRIDKFNQKYGTK